MQRFNASLKDLSNKKLKSNRLYVIVLLLLIICNSSVNRDLNTLISYIDDFGFGFDLPASCYDITDGELGQSLIEINPTIEFIAKVELDFGNTLFSVSAYDLKKITTIDSAFSQAVNYRGMLGEIPVSNYKLTDYGKERFNDKDFRYKISCTDDRIYNIMYYFMREDLSNVLYEIKLISPSEKDVILAKDFLLNVALTVEFYEPPKSDADSLNIYTSIDNSEAI
jgi:hypothetical protein